MRKMYIPKIVDEQRTLELARRHAIMGEQVMVHYHAFGEQCNDRCKEIQ